MSFFKPAPWSHSLPYALLLMAPFDILASLAMDIYLPVVPAMPAVLATTPGVVQLTLSLYMVTLGLGQLAFGPLCDRFGRRPVLLGGALLYALASLLLAAGSDATAFVVLRVAQAAGASAMLVATFATVRDVYAGRPEGAVIYSLFGSMLAFVPALGPIVGALIAELAGWRAIFLTLTALAAVALGQALLRWPETRPAAPSAGGPGPGTILASARFWTYTLGFAAAMGAFFVYFSTAPRVLIERAGHASTGFSLLFGSVAVVMIVTARFVRPLVARHGAAGMLARGMLVMLAGAGFLAFGALTAAPSFWSFVLPMWLVGVGIVFTSAVAANGALAEFGDAAGLAVALYFAIQSVVVGAAGTLAVIALGGDTAWPLVGFIAVAAGTVLAALARLAQRGAAP